MADARNAPQEELGAREKLGGNIILFSTIALSILAVVTLVGGYLAARQAQKPELFTDTSQLMFSSLLPLFGTWVGTVLAFYFSKENFKVASDATRDLIQAAGGRLHETGVREAMIPRAGIIGAVIAPGGRIEDVPFTEIEAAFAKEFASGRKITRLVILGQNDVCLVIIHRSLWNEMHRVGAIAAPAVNFATGKLGDVLALKTDVDPSRSYRQILTDTLAHVSLNGTLADAKARMEAIVGCQDAAVTDTGGRSEPLRGWVTNVEIQKALRA